MNIQDIVVQVFTDIMQDMGFIDVAPCDDGDINIENFVAAKLDIVMPYAGDIVVVFSDELAKEIVENIAGKYNLETQGLLHDSINEILNVLGGRIFDSIGPDLLFELGLPQVLDKIDDKLSGKICQSFVTPENKAVQIYHNLRTFTK